MITDRLKQYIEYKGLSYYNIEQNIGVSNGTLSKAIKQKMNLGSQTIESILKVYTDINPAWLMLGEGDMLREYNLSYNLGNKPLKEFDLTEYIRSKDEKIEQQSFEIGMLKKEIEYLKKK